MEGRAPCQDERSGGRRPQTEFRWEGHSTRDWGGDSRGLRGGFGGTRGQKRRREYFHPDWCIQSLTKYQRVVFEVRLILVLNIPCKEKGTDGLVFLILWLQRQGNKTEGTVSMSLLRDHFWSCGTFSPVLENRVRV